MTLKREFAQTMVLQRFTQLLYQFIKPDLGYIPQLKPNRPMLNKVKKLLQDLKDLFTKHNGKLIKQIVTTKTGFDISLLEIIFDYS